MKIIDKYILKQYFTPLFYSFTTFFMIFVIFDLFEHLSEFIEAEITFAQVVKYYLFVLPSMLIFITPISLLLAILYTMYQFTRHNELIAFQASGVSMPRIIAPFVIIGISASVFVSVVNETIVPDTSYWAYQFLNQETGNDEDAASIRYARNLPFKNESENRIWAIEKFDRELYDMHGVTIRQSRKDGSDLKDIRAETAKWLDGTWWFFDVTVKEFDKAGNPQGAVKDFSRMEMSDLTETPKDFEIVTKNIEFKSAFELWQYLLSHPHLSHPSYARIAVDMHTRLAMPWSCLIIMLFGIPSGVFTGRKGAMAGIILALAAFFCFYILATICAWMGKTQILPPALSAWLPNLIFLAIGLIWMKTA